MIALTIAFMAGFFVGFLGLAWWLNEGPEPVSYENKTGLD